MAVEIVTTSLEAVKQSMSSCHERSTKARHAAQLILDKQKLKEPEILACFEKFSSELVNYFQSEIKSSTARLRSLSSKKERLWSLFHRIRMKDCLTLMWETLATKLNVSDNDPLLKQSLFEKVYEKCLYTYFAKYRCAHTDVKEDNVELTTHEANVVQYVGGYVARTLLKRHEKKDGDVESQYIQCLGDMAVEFEEGEGDDVLAYTRKWLEQTNRGGLFPINDTSFSLFAHIETCVCSLLPTYLRTTCTNSDKDKFQENVLKKILENEELQFTGLC